jgi:hypothetical protein
LSAYFKCLVQAFEFKVQAKNIASQHHLRDFQYIRFLRRTQNFVFLCEIFSKNQKSNSHYKSLKGKYHKKPIIKAHLENNVHKYVLFSSNLKKFYLNQTF